MSFTAAALVDALDIEAVETDRYRATHAEAGHGVVFGGQLMAQAIVAALKGNDGKRAKTLHIVFMRAGSTAAPLDIAVERLHAGRAMATSAVTFSQGERLVARATVLMTADEPDLIRHADRPVALSKPDEVASNPDSQDSGWDVRIVDNVDLMDPDAVGPADLDVWTRFVGVPTDPALGQALLSYATDGFLIATAMRPHEGVGQAQSHKTLSTGVLGHTITFHEPFSAADWLLIAHHSPYAGRGRAYGSANVFREDGELVASFVQDSMIRPMAASPGSM
jgi:acyl-CoA thioesterase II